MTRRFEVRLVLIIGALTIAFALLGITACPTAVAGGSISVQWEGHVYYSDGTTPLPDATVYIYYPSTEVEPTYVQTTMPDGLYQAGGILDGKAYRIVAVKDGVYSPEINGNIYNTGGSPIMVSDDLVVPISPPGPTFSLNGQVVYESNGTPVSGATIHIGYSTYSYTMTAGPAGGYGIGPMPFTGDPVTVWATIDSLSSGEQTFTPVTGENVQNLLIRSTSPSSSPTPEPVTHHNPMFYIFTTINGSSENDVLVTCQFNGATYSGVSHYMDIETTVIMLSYHGPGALYMEVPQGHTGTVTFTATKGNYEGHYTMELPYPYDFASSFTIALTPREATPTPVATLIATVSPTGSASPTQAVTPVPDTNSTGIAGDTGSAGTNVTATVTQSPTPRVLAGLPGGLGTYAAVGIAAIVLILVLIGLALVLLRRK